MKYYKTTGNETIASLNEKVPPDQPKAVARGVARETGDWKRADPNDPNNPFMGIPKFKKMAEKGELYTNTLKIVPNDQTSNPPVSPIKAETLVGLWTQSSGAPRFASIYQPIEGLKFDKDGDLTILIGQILFTGGKYAVIPGNKLRVDGFPGGTQFGRAAEFDMNSFERQSHFKTRNSTGHIS